MGGTFRKVPGRCIALKVPGKHLLRGAFQVPCAKGTTKVQFKCTFQEHSSPVDITAPGGYLSTKDTLKVPFPKCRGRGSIDDYAATAARMPITEVFCFEAQFWLLFQFAYCASSLDS